MIFWTGFMSWVFLTGLVSLMPMAQHPALKNGGDKIAHLVFYMPFGVIGFFHPRGGMKPVWLVSTFAANLGFLMELLQRNVPGRGFEYLDLAGDILGVMLGVIFFEIIRRTKWGRSRSWLGSAPAKY
jgi:VanZ family protein